MAGNRRRIRLEIEHAPHTLDDLEQPRGLRKLDFEMKLMLAPNRADCNLPGMAVKRDAAPVFLEAGHDPALGALSRDVLDQRAPVVRRPVSETERVQPRAAILARRSGAAQLRG